MGWLMELILSSLGGSLKEAILQAIWFPTSIHNDTHAFIHSRMEQLHATFWIYAISTTFCGQSPGASATASFLAKKHRSSGASATVSYSSSLSSSLAQAQALVLLEMLL